MSNLWPRVAMNVAQHKIVNLLKMLLNFIAKVYYLGMYIFYVSDHKLGTRLMILKDYQKGC